MQTTSNRNKNIDIAKGISILLMPISHLTFFQNYELVMDINEILVLFKLPLFIFISGLLFSEKKSFKEFFVQKFDGLLKPTLFLLLTTGFCSLIYHIYTNQGFELAYKRIISIYFPLWFPMVLFISLVLFKGLFELNSRKTTSFAYIVSVTSIILLLYFFTRKEISISLLSAYSILYFLIILFISFYFKKKDLFNQIFDKKILIAAILIFSFCIYNRDLLNIELNLFDNKFGLLIPTAITFMSGIVIVFNIAYYLSKNVFISKILIECSKSSFFILAFHVLLGNIILQPLCAKLFSPSPLLDLLVFILTILGCILIHKLTFHIKLIRNFMLPKKVIENYENKKEITYKEQKIA